MKYEAFVELNNHLVQRFYDCFQHETWFGFNFLAIDGTTLRVPFEDEDYKILKYRLQVENFSGKSELSVYQDFNAKLFSKNLAAAVASTTKDEILKKSKLLKFVHQINFAQALSKMKNTIVLLCNRSHEKVCPLVKKLRTIFINTTEAIRTNIKCSRKQMVKQQCFS